MSHSSTLAWSYLVLFGGIAIVIIGIIAAIHGAHSSKSSTDFSPDRSPERSDDPKLKRRMETLENLMRAGDISREEYNRRRTEILVERYKRHAG